MRRKFTKSLTSLVVMAMTLGIAASPLMAAEKMLSLREIKAMAKENNKELQALRTEKGIGEAGRIRAGLYPNPVLEMDGATGSLTGSSGEQRIGIGFSQEILTGGKRDKRQAVAEAELVRFEHQLAAAERHLLTSVTTGYFDLFLAEGRRDLAAKSKELNGQLLQIARERFAAGEIAELDVNLAKVEAARSSGKMIEAEREIIPLRQHLLSLMGGSVTERLTLAPLPEQGGVTADLADLKTMALQKRPDLQAVTAEQHKNAAELTLAETERLPNVTAGATVLWERSETSLGGLSERSNDYLIGLKLSIPLPVFDRNQAGIREALARKSSADIRQQNLRLTIEREVESAYGRLAAAEETLKVYGQEIVPQLTENLRLTQEAYRLGEVGILAVIEEQKKFIDVSEGNLLAQYERTRALARLEAAVGTEMNILDGGKNE